MNQLTEAFVAARNAINRAMNNQAISKEHGNSELFYLRDKLDEAALDVSKSAESITYFQQKIAEFTGKQ